MQSGLKVTQPLEGIKPRGKAAVPRVKSLSWQARGGRVRWRPQGGRVQWNGRVHYNVAPPNLASAEARPGVKGSVLADPGWEGEMAGGCNVR